MTEGDFISDNFGKRLRPDLEHPIRCSESLIEVQQRKDDGKIWISSNWLYFLECYGSAAPITEAIIAAITKPAGGDKDLSDRIRETYWKANELNRDEFMMELERYSRDDGLRGGHWAGGYAFAASRAWRIKNRQQLDEALKVEDRHFLDVLEEYMRWLGNKVIQMPEEDEITLKEKITEEYHNFPRKAAHSLCDLLVEEDKAAPSDVYLWWGGEPNRDACYALLTLYFEVDPEDIGTSRFDEKVSRNLKAILNIAEKDVWLNSIKEYEPLVWRAIFS